MKHTNVNLAPDHTTVAASDRPPAKKVKMMPENIAMSTAMSTSVAFGGKTGGSVQADASATKTGRVRYTVIKYTNGSHQYECNLCKVLLNSPSHIKEVSLSSVVGCICDI